SQRSHWVYTAQALAFQGKVYQSLSSNKVIFRALTEEEIKAYCASEEPYGKAGGYGIQGTASYLIQALQCRYSAVVGLDIYVIYQLLQQAGLQQLFFPPRQPAATSLRRQAKPKQKKTAQPGLGWLQ